MTNREATIKEGMEIIEKRSLEEDGTYNKELTQWALTGVYDREGRDAAIEYAKTTPFHIDAKRYVGHY